MEDIREMERAGGGTPQEGGGGEGVSYGAHQDPDQVVSCLRCSGERLNCLEGLDPNSAELSTVVAVVLISVAFEKSH